MEGVFYWSAIVAIVEEASGARSLMLIVSE